MKIRTKSEMTEALELTWDFNGKGEVFLVDKPIDWTSFDVVKRIRSAQHIQKIGHAGTLDPKATGLLILCTGPKTKSIVSFVSLEKEYIGTMEIGVKTASFDSESPVIEEADYSAVTEEMVRNTATSFLGIQDQIPPMFSAVKVKGKPLYKYARKGKTVERSPKQIEVRDFTVTNIQLPYIGFRIVCSKGTYIRSLVDDFGRKLNCGATLRSLKRTRIGNHALGDAFDVSTFLNVSSKNSEK